MFILSTCCSSNRKGLFRSSICYFQRNFAKFETCRSVLGVLWCQHNKTAPTITPNSGCYHELLFRRKGITYLGFLRDFISVGSWNSNAVSSVQLIILWVWHSSFVYVFEKERQELWCGSPLEILPRSGLPFLSNFLSSLFETTYIYNDFNGGYNCVLIVRVRKHECEWYKMRILKHPNV